MCVCVRVYVNINRTMCIGMYAVDVNVRHILLDVSTTVVFMMHGATSLNGSSNNYYNKCVSGSVYSHHLLTYMICPFSITRMYAHPYVRCVHKLDTICTTKSNMYADSRYICTPIKWDYQGIIHLHTYVHKSPRCGGQAVIDWSAV